MDILYLYLVFSYLYMLGYILRLTRHEDNLGKRIGFVMWWFSPVALPIVTGHDNCRKY